ncbi:MAG TPA: TolC family protein [Cyclobacteriaceae bacterium]|nr:TolC family protein [Cyclobacteriaceae bacterium]
MNIKNLNLVYPLIVSLSLFSINSYSQRTQQTLSLSEVMSLANANNRELKAAQLEIERADQQRVIARSAFLPTISLNAQANHYFQLPAFFGFGENPEQDKISYGRFGGEDQFAAGITAVQPLFAPWASPSVQRARLQQKQSIAAAEAKRAEIVSEIRTTYLMLLVLNERIKLKQESIIRNKRVLLDARSLFIQGKGLRVDTLRAFTAVKNLEPDLIKLSYASETGNLQLRSLIGLDSLPDFKPADSLQLFITDDSKTEEQVYDEIRSTNPELRMLTIQTELDEQQEKVASSYYLPVISFVGQYQVQSQTNNFDYGTAHYPGSSFVGLQISVPIFTGFSTYAKVRQASLAKNQSSLLLKQRQQQLRADVHDALSNSREALLRLESTVVVEETAKLSYTIIQYRYKSGIASRLELTDAELALSTAQSNYLEAVYDYLSAQIAINKLRGVAE